jgi:putative spermidine/putrescine transport system permease protein
MAARDDAFGWLYISPLMLVLLPFFVAPILVVFAASFMQSDGFGGIIASPTLQNYIDIFSSGLTANLYYETVKFTLLTWLFSLIMASEWRTFWSSISAARCSPSAFFSSAPCRSGPRTSSA